MGSTGVRRPKPSKSKGSDKVEAVPVKVVEKVKKVAEKPTVEPKPKVKTKVAELPVAETETKVAPEKTVKKTEKKPSAKDVPE